MLFRKTLSKAALSALAALLLIGSAQAADLSLQNVPLYLLSRADPNVLLEMSVETPMGGAAYNDQSGNPAACTGRVTVSGKEVGRCYIPTVRYIGYFNSLRCYTYSGTQFNPASTVASTSTSCGGTGWSGNFLNWATMTAIDMFTYTMTGGNRIVDDATQTVVKRARKTDNAAWFPTKIVTNSTSGTVDNVAPNTVTPLTNSTIYIYNTAFGFQVGTTFDKANSAPDLGSFNVRVKVCDPGLGTTTASGFDSNCVAYGAGTPYYKPEGLIQSNALQKRFAVTSYSLDNSQTRDGGVLRSNMKYVGPKLPDGTNNTKKEYGADGIFINNPDGATGGLNSGVINYVNQFSEPGYKSYDPIGELYYESLRFFKHLPPTPEYTSGLTTAQCGGFQVLTTWEDPMVYRCQKNFIIAINDANPWLDKKLPGTFFTSSTLATKTGFTPNPWTLLANDYGQPSNPDGDIDVRALTNRVGQLEGLNGTTWSSTGTWTSTGSASSQTGANDSVGGGLNTWDNSCSDKTVGNLGEVMGTCPYPGKENSYYVAGLAFYANTNDLRPDLANDRGIQNVASFVIDTQEFSTNPLDGPKNMLWLAGKYGGFVDVKHGTTPPDGIPQQDEWDADGDGQPDNYVLATKPQSLVSGLSRAFDFIDSQTSSAASASVNSGSISSSTRVYQALFNSTDWTGQLLSTPVNANGSLGAQEWDAAAKLPAFGSRKIITVNANTNAGAAFAWASIGATRQGQLMLDATDTAGPERLLYLRGDPANEGKYRKRTAPVPSDTAVMNKLGDIINSEPVYVGKPSFLYSDPSYITFRNNNANRTPMVYVGANDGMLHAFNASTTAAASSRGVESLAFVPGTVFRNLIELTKPSYSHQYYVDGSPTMGDAYFGSAWHTMLVGGLNKGGQGVYALDVTDPSNFTEANAASIFKWEFSDTNDADLGYTFSRPAIVKLHNGKWAAVFGNGYNNTFDDTAAGGQKSATGNAVLYIVDISDGSLIKKIDTGAGTAQDPLAQARPNGLATPALVDLNGDSVADYAFAGDLFGNLWKFDLTNASETSWSIAFSGVPLFKATDSASKAQPITERPEVGRGPNGRGMLVVFGTGKFLEAADKDVTLLSTQTFYGVIDPNTASSGIVTNGRADLTQQQIILEDTQSIGGISRRVRATTQNSVGSTQRGWYLDLLSGPPGIPPPSGFKGEMSVSDPILRNGRVIFTTLIPTPDPCLFGGTSWLMELDALSGGRLNYTPFDLNDDTKFDSSDYVTLADGTKVPASGLQTDVGITAKPGVLSGDGAEYKYGAGTAVSAATGTNMAVVRENPGPGDVGRQSWRQLR